MKPLFVLFILLGSVSVQAQTFPNTLFLAEGESSPPATFKDIPWIEGTWKGEAFGGTAEEIWSAPMGNAMMCAFRHVVDAENTFYELVTLTEENGSLIMRLKHFDAMLKGWETQEETVDFPLVKVLPNKIYFNGLTYEKVDDDHLNVYVVVDEGGETQELLFAYTRVKD